MKKISRDSVTAKGFYKLQIVEHEKDGTAKVVSTTDWMPNQITNLGFQHFIVGSLGAVASSSQVSYFALGTGAAPAAADTALSGELTDASNLRFAVSPSAVSSKTLQLTGSLASNIITATHNISNVGIFAGSTTAAGTLFAGNTYASSLLNTNQSVNVTLIGGVKTVATLFKQLREFGGQLIESIPSRASKFFEEGVQTMYEATLWVEDIGGTIWRQIELGRNDPILALAM